MDAMEYWQTVGQWEEYSASLANLQQKSEDPN